MICSFEVAEEQLRLALAAIEKAKSKGFLHTNAIMAITSVNPDGSNVRASFVDSVILRNHPTDPSKNWGNKRVNQIGWYKCVDNECVNDYSED